MIIPETMPILTPTGCLLGAWTEWCWVPFPFGQCIVKPVPCPPRAPSLGKPHSSAQPYLMNFSMTSSTHICSRRKLMP